uniref:tRNA (Cytosine5)methyltransferase NSUN2like protein putative n=1 Tax=Albugo laibachii Nc14 TaxID=890382 RepID=F0WAH4_9STRA|nr:tRNA (cytosine5)methyltransferase NSUN2like protein putative [Albugo laibachii Nc14]|eukprot:CCA18145.1 tRNA (cytosine5)methyltransferase NSUN2like protein putative [Albugo laibachii Nc14]
MAGQGRFYQKEAPFNSRKKSQSRSNAKQKRVVSRSDIVDRRKRARDHIKAREQANANRLHGEEVRAKRQKLCKEVAEKIVWRKFDRKNEAFENFYKQVMQTMYPNCDNFDKVWATFVKCIERSICVHFRFNLNHADLAEKALYLLESEIIPEYINNESNRQKGSEDLSGTEAAIQIAPLEWTSHNKHSLWKVSVDAKTFRKKESLMNIYNFVYENTKFGLIIRHDPTINILPELLSIQSSDRILDLCGGGGENGIRAPVIAERFSSPDSTGVLVVNETSIASGTVAIRNLSRTLTCSANVIVTTHRILDYPQMESMNDGFDRVLCMVPCSGDGLIRNCPEKWRTWTALKGVENHSKQIKLLTKALSLVKVGGTVLYCTRSMNPIENEAVVTAVLDNGLCEVELVDIHSIIDEKFPAFLKHPGVESWAVFGEEMQTLSSCEKLNEKDKTKFSSTMWPKPKRNLDRCVRVLPHENDTHAFFFAALTKCTAEAIPTVSAAPTAEKADKRPSDRHKQSSTGNHFTPLKRQNWKNLVQCYGLKSNNQDSFLQKRQSIQNGQYSVHLVSEQAIKILTSRHVGKLAVQRAGVEAFHLTPSISRVEITDVGAQALAPALSKQIIPLPIAIVEQLLDTKEVWNHQLPALTLEHVESLQDGSFVAVIETPCDQDEDSIGFITCVKYQNGISMAASPDLNYNRSRLLFLLSRYRNSQGSK